MISFSVISNASVYHSVRLITDWWLMTTPFGTPVEPEVNRA